MLKISFGVLFLTVVQGKKKTKKTATTDKALHSEEA